MVPRRRQVTSGEADELVSARKTAQRELRERCAAQGVDGRSLRYRSGRLPVPTSIRVMEGTAVLPRERPRLGVSVSMHLPFDSLAGMAAEPPAPLPPSPELDDHPRPPEAPTDHETKPRKPRTKKPPPQPPVVEDPRSDRTGERVAATLVNKDFAEVVLIDFASDDWRRRRSRRVGSRCANCGRVTTPATPGASLPKTRLKAAFVASVLFNKSALHLHPHLHLPLERQHPDLARMGKVHDAKDSGPALAVEGERRIAMWFDQERIARGQGLVGAALQAWRHQDNRPLVHPFGRWIEAGHPTVRPKAPLAEGVRCDANHRRARNRALPPRSAPGTQQLAVRRQPPPGRLPGGPEAERRLETRTTSDRLSPADRACGPSDGRGDARHPRAGAPQPA